jgi:hypothetical protein
VLVHINSARSILAWKALVGHHGTQHPLTAMHNGMTHVGMTGIHTLPSARPLPVMPGRANRTSNCWQAG